MNYKIIRENIWQIADDHGVFCTLVQGEKLAVLWDTGYGSSSLKEFVENNIKTDYIVMNSHGHPDHIGGNSQFGCIYANREEWDVIEHFTVEETGKMPDYSLKELTVGKIFELGGIRAKVISMEGHTKGSVGLLLEKELPKSIVKAHLKNIAGLKPDEKAKCNTIGFETYTSTYEGTEGKSVIVFSKDVLT